MGNPIQYCNTDNLSQMGGGVATTSGGVVTTTYHCETPPGSFTMEKALLYTPLGILQRGVNENFTPGHPSIYSFSRRGNGKHEKISLCRAEVVFDRCQVSKC